MPKSTSKSQIILGFVGELAGGKGTACKYLIKKYNAGYYRFSTMLRDILNRLYIEQSRENIQTISKALRKSFGNDLFSKILCEDVKQDTHKLIVIDGIRRFPEITHLKRLKNFKLVYVTANIETRLKRIKKRGENSDDNKKNLDQFKRDEQSEVERQIPKIGKTSDFIIDNNGSQRELYGQLDNIIKKIQ
ncbi:MAG: AAA family ATPase [bacterium]